MKTERTSRIFRIPANVHVKAGAQRVFLRTLPVLLTALAVTAWLAVDDLRFLYVGLILLFVVYPSVLSFMWLRMAVAPDVQQLIRPQRWTLREDALIVDYFGYDDPEGAEAPRQTVEIPLSLVVGFEDNGSYATVRRKDEASGAVSRLTAPSDAFGPDGWQILRDVSDAAAGEVS